ncbi:MAG TPA: hypothetical protein EYN66_02565, partial [Myxococcales bacterium]|nr:hypothetical protein [Myxococcales bacterium]
MQNSEPFRKPWFSIEIHPQGEMMKSWFHSPLSTFVILVIAVSILGACSQSSSDGEQEPGNDLVGNEINEPDSKEPESDIDAVVEPVVVTVEASIEEGNAPLDVKLKCVATGADPSELNYTFKVGSAPPTSLNELDFTFYEQGDYDVCCTAWRKDGKYTSEEVCKLIRVKKAAELSITSPTVDGPAELAQGQCLNVSFTIANNGGRVDDSFEVGCVLSPYPNQNWADDPEKHLALKSWTIDSIKDGEFLTQKVAYESEELCIADDVEDGQYFLLCKVDAKDEINEQNEGDNDRFATTFITIDHTLVLLPDLVIPTLELPQDQLFPKNWDDQLSYKLLLKNQGEAEAGQFNYAVYLCDSEEFDDECFVINDSGSTIFSMKAGASIPISRGWPITPGMADGTYCLIVVVDTENSVAESNEENNQTTTNTCFEVKYEELAGIDLVVSNLKCSPKEAVWNGSFVVSFEVSNTGNTASSPWDYKAVLNQQPTTNVFEPYKKLCDNKAACMNLAGLEPGAKVKVQETYIISKDLPLSDYYCMVHADSKKTVDETNETNNFSTYGYKIKVLAKAYTDVFVADLSFTKQNTLAGKSIKLMYQMGNNNESSAAGVTVCAVLSADNKVSVAGIKSGKDIIIGEKFYELIESGAQNTFFEDEAKYVIPIALDHAVGEYFVGVVADCKSVLKNDTVKTN